MRVKRPILLLLGVALALTTTVVKTFRGTSRSSVLNDLAEARPARMFAARLSIPTEYRACTVLPPKDGGTVPRDSCGAASDHPVALNALAAVEKSADPDSLQASALMAMVGWNETESALNDAIKRLSRALRLSRRVSLLVDLSGAYLARAQDEQNPHDLMEGLNYARQALESEPHNPAALFNAALALEALTLDDQATRAWTDYLRIDSTSEWAGEARRRLPALQHPPEPRGPTPLSSFDEVRTFAARHPQQARLLGLDSVLGQWGRKLETGDTAAARGWLRLADWLGIALASREGGDASIADAVGAIHAAADDPAETRKLARAHRAFAVGQVLFASDHDAARDSFTHVIAARPRSPALVHSAEVARAGTLVFSDRRAQAEMELATVLPRIDSVRYPGLFARAEWARATRLTRDNHFAMSRELYETVARRFGRLGETEYSGAAWAMAGEAAYRQGDTLTAYPLMHRGMVMLRGYRWSVRLHNALFVLANCLDADGLSLAASDVQDEDVAVAMRDERSTGPVEALLGRAWVRSARGLFAEAAEDVDSAQARVEKLPPSKRRTTLSDIVRYSRAVVATNGASIAELDSAVDAFTKDGNLAWLLPALLQRVEVRLDRHDLPGATADLNDATTRIQGVSRDLRYASLRAAVMDKARNSFDKLVMLHARANEPGEALQALERGRVSFAPGFTGALTPSRPVAPPRHVAMEYALIGDTLLIWTVRGDDVKLVGGTVDRDAFLQLIEQVDADLESPARATSVGPGLERLYNLLIRPVQVRLGPFETPLVILADGEIAAVPFSALRDSRRGRYLMEDHASRVAATLADASRPAPPTDGFPHPALFVADPAFDRAQYPRLPRLKGARGEVDSLRLMYRESVVLDSTGATRAALTRLAPHASLIHYAGHALFNDARPEQSALVLADSGRLTAEAVNSLDLRGVRLVVLSACSTARSREGRSGGFAGFSGALLAAGAGGVMGSLWEVDDSLTQPLMLAFHRAYQESHDPAAALRDAQLHMLQLSDPALKSPAAWASFRYIGS